MENRKSVGNIVWLNDVGEEQDYAFGDNGHRSESDPHGSEKLENIESAVRMILSNVNEDPERQGLVGTPNRIARMYSEVLGGYTVDLEKLVNGALFDVTYDEMIVVKDIEFYSMCEHHMLPFFGKAHVAYIPSNKVIGLSKIPRIVEMFSRRLQVQERMTRQIADTIDEILDPQGVAIIIEGSHMCSMMRGVKKQEASMVTSAMLGCFKSNDKTRNEFLSHVRGI
jgi:GTP cyclohydrolase I